MGRLISQKLRAGPALALIICKIELAMVMFHPNMQTPTRQELVGQSGSELIFMPNSSEGDFARVVH